MDVACSTPGEAALWVRGVRQLVKQALRAAEGARLDAEAALEADIAAQREERERGERERLARAEAADAQRRSAATAAAAVDATPPRAALERGGSLRVRAPPSTSPGEASPSGGAGGGDAIARWAARVFPAVRAGNVGIVTSAFSAGCPVDIVDLLGDSGDTPMLAACRAGHHEVVRACLAAGAKNDPHPHFGQTALLVAVSAGHVECARQILDAAAASGVAGAIVSHNDREGLSPLHSAARRGDARGCEMLLCFGANICAIDGAGRTAVHVAAMCAGAGEHEATRQGFTETAQLLLEYARARRYAFPVLRPSLDVCISPCAQVRRRGRRGPGRPRREHAAAPCGRGRRARDRAAAARDGR